MGILRLLARRLRPPPGPSVPPPRAPGAMRQRVLASVRGDGRPLEPRPHRGPGGLWLGYALGLIAAGALGGAVVLAIPGEHTARAPRTPGPRAQLRRVGSRAELIVSGMSDPPPGQVYELWIERGAQPPRPTDALFTVTSAGDGTVEVPGGLRGVSGVMVTREPRGGSSTPTGAPILRVAVHRHG